MNTIDTTIIDIRRRLGWTQVRLANELGVDVSTIWRWESQGVPKRGAARAFLSRFAASLDAAPLPPASSTGAASTDTPPSVDNPSADALPPASAETLSKEVTE